MDKSFSKISHKLSSSKILLFVLVLSLAFVIGCTVTGTQEASDVNVMNDGGFEVDEVVEIEIVFMDISYLDANGQAVFEEVFEVEKGANAFEVMKENLEVEYEEFSFGVMVNSIENVSPSNGYYLALYVNDSYADRGITDYLVEEDIVILWKMEKLEDFGLS